MGLKWIVIIAWIVVSIFGFYLLYQKADFETKEEKVIFESPLRVRYPELNFEEKNDGDFVDLRRLKKEAVSSPVVFASAIDESKPLYLIVKKVNGDFGGLGRSTSIGQINLVYIGYSRLDYGVLVSYIETHNPPTEDYRWQVGSVNTSGATWIFDPNATENIVALIIVGILWCAVGSIILFAIYNK
ncbi:MAG: hypothetical protein A3B96_03940 [Candidatus Spechtbacteria bacterium RIFCSPHIGHO2_02_FULL_43_15b]|nr:MAG: hypothetical protein A3B96_03940 [Candidatus Spechtbacteria bacterium RIFCSPHIGHO2_02_FULL_43_15b]